MPHILGHKEMEGRRKKKGGKKEKCARPMDAPFFTKVGTTSEERGERKGRRGGFGFPACCRMRSFKRRKGGKKKRKCGRGERKEQTPCTPSASPTKLTQKREGRKKKGKGRKPKMLTFFSHLHSGLDEREKGEKRKKKGKEKRRFAAAN